ncbi:MAG TPA: hypothetical protein ENK90_02795, partial [Epsilonproteobacteria bacterium]|nr:hypothetical protein [Campylobacterota bacterium]
MIKKIYLILTCILFVNTSLMAENQNELAPDHIELATMMFYDGKHKKALKELQLAKDSHMDIDWLKYYSIKGMIYLKESKYPQAITSLKKAINAAHKKVYKAPVEEKEKPKYLFSLFSEKKKEQKPKVKKPVFDPEKLRREKIEELYIYLSQAYYRNKQYLQTVNALDKAGKRGRDSASLFTLRAECYWKANKKDAAITALSKGSKLFPKDATLLKQKFYYFAELKLYQAAIAAAKAYMAKVPASDQEYISLAQMLISGGESNEAVKVLEEAKMRFPSSAKIHVLLGHLYYKKDMLHTTAQLFEEGSYFDAKYLKEAAEMYRRAGVLSHALYLNSKMTDKKEKTKQKIAIYLDRGEFEKIIGLKDAMGRYGLLADD